MSLTCQSTTNRIMIWVTICLFSAVFANVYSNEVVRRSTYADAPALKDGDPCDATTFNRITCENDRLQFCGPSLQIASAPCSVNGRPGFCNCEKTSCVAEKPTCGEATGCLTPNTKLPDNLDCRKFSYCNADKKKITLTCPGNLIYDPNTEKCTDIGRCARLSCPRTNPIPLLLAFPQARNYYVLCFQGVGDVRKCEDKYYSVQTMECKFDCKLKKQVGLFRDTNLERCKSGYYYACSRAGLSFRTTEGKCDPGMYFDETLGICTATDTCQQGTDTPPEQ